jgi:uncharacterized protein GlcG (DUF336 family)
MNLVTSSAVLTFEAGLAAVESAVRKALEFDTKVNAAVVDVGGNLLAFVRNPGAFVHSASIAQDKAFTAASFGFATSNWGAIVSGNDMLRDGLMQRDRLVMIGGGLPIVVDGQVVGGIGVSGASEEQDEMCAQAGLCALGLSTD